MTPRTSYGPLLAGLLGHLFWSVAVFGFVRTLASDRVSATVAMILGGVVGHWFVAFFGGGGHSIRRTVRSGAVTALVAVAGFAVMVLAGGGGALEVATLWGVAWLVGAASAAGDPMARTVRWRRGWSVVAGGPLLAGTLLLAQQVGALALPGLAVVALVYPAADALADRAGERSEATAP